jgi:hypothetical protein
MVGDVELVRLVVAIGPRELGGPVGIGGGTAMGGGSAQAGGGSGGMLK